MNIYEYVSEIVSSKSRSHWDSLPYSFTQESRSRLEADFDFVVFDLFMKAYEITIIYKPERRDDDSKSEFRKNGDEGISSFSNVELNVFNSLDWTRLPHYLKAHVYDVIWLRNHKYEAARTAAEEYYESYRECFDEVYWVKCVDYISRAIELAAKLGLDDKKEDFLMEVYNDIVRLNGEDSSFLSISLIELLISQSFSCDYNTLIPLADKLISNNESSGNNAYVLEQAYYVKAKLYQKMRDTTSENYVYVQYAETLIKEAEKLVKTSNGEEDADNRNWFMAEINIKKAIELFQNHGARDKAADAQKRLVDVQKESIKHIQKHEIKIDVTNYYNEFCSEYEGHDIRELVWDVAFAFGFQNKKKIHDEVVKDVSPISAIFPMQMIGPEGQTEFLLPPLDLNDENNILLHMYHKARENERLQGQTFGVWFIQYFRKLGLQESDLDMIFKNNPIIPNGQEKDVQRGVYYGLIGRMSDSLDKLAPKVENIIRNLAEMCGDLMTYYDSKEGVQQKKVLSQVFNGEKLNECINENILFTLDGLLQQKSGSNIRNRIGHGLSTEKECSTGDCIYFVMIVLKFCALHCVPFIDECERRSIDRKQEDADRDSPII